LSKREAELALTIGVKVTILAVGRLTECLTARVVVAHHAHEVALAVLSAKAVVALLSDAHRLIVAGEGEGGAGAAPVLKLKAGGVGGVIAAHVLRGGTTGRATKSYPVKVDAGAALALVVALARVAEAARVHPPIQVAEPTLVVFVEGAHLLIAARPVHGGGAIEAVGEPEGMAELVGEHALHVGEVGRGGVGGAP
jgi:hypothetical protein